MIAKYVTPWRFRRQQEAQRLTALRQHDGDDCRRCRRPIRFDLTPGHDKGPKVERIGETDEIDSLCLCHGRCNADAGDDTGEVTERVRRKNEAALFSKPRKRAGRKGG